MLAHAKREREKKKEEAKKKYELSLLAQNQPKCCDVIQWNDADATTEYPDVQYEPLPTPPPAKLPPRPVKRPMRQRTPPPAGLFRSKPVAPPPSGLFRAKPVAAKPTPPVQTPEPVVVKMELMALVDQATL